MFQDHRCHFHVLLDTLKPKSPNIHLSITLYITTFHHPSTHPRSPNSRSQPNPRSQYNSKYKYSGSQQPVILLYPRSQRPFPQLYSRSRHPIIQVDATTYGWNVPSFKYMQGPNVLQLHPSSKHPHPTTSRLQTPAPNLI